MNYRHLHQCNSTHKLFLIATALLAGSLITNGQTNVAIASIKMNVLYIGVDNPVSVAASSAADDKVTVSIRGGEGTVSKSGEGLYNVRVANVTDECFMDVYVDEKLVGTSKFRVRSLPYPVATVGGRSSGEAITADAFLTQAGIGMYIKDFPFEVKYEILSFSFIVAGDNDVKSADCQGAFFSPLAKQYIDQYVKAGKIVTIENIRAKDSGGREFKIPSLIYQIK